ncbi:hypothetical protein ETW23_03830 [Leisingera sp. NJS201]|uniref:hypothetical protein n=1 Tax=Leisingera sp. NJS201 TaxID=2508306 RepID=UPI001070E8BF|nr:hypothetical protein [Leisingera sp. NJS201]QBR35396.1 hypothetical protein ETW23_03830 [Leisingera sp. NJS201]
MTELVTSARGRASAYLAGRNLAIVKAVAVRRQRQGQGAGKRLPAALAGAPVQLVELSRPLPGTKAQKERITLPGQQTARRALPPLLAKLPENDPRSRAAKMLGDAVERVGAVRGADLAGADSKGGVSDGGATTRVKHAARLRMIEALANRWPVDRRHGPQRSVPRVLLTVKRPSEKRRNIRAFDALMAVCVDGDSVDAILRAHGWSAQAFNRNPLRDAILAALADVAEGLGLGRVAEQQG